MNTLEEELPHALDGQRIDRIVSLVTGMSRSQAASAVESGLASVNGRVVSKVSTRLAAGDILVVEVEDRPDPLRPDPSVAVNVTYVDDQVIVVDKHPGLVVHPGAGVDSATLVHGLLARFPDLLELSGLDDPPIRPGIVHRLDRGTSGLLVVARTVEAKESLTEQLRTRTMGRRYEALVTGQMEADSGLIDAPLGRSSRSPTTRTVVADGRPARTHYVVSDRFDEPPCTLVGVRLETGRTHQIRAHFQAVGHPVSGDQQYGDGDVLEVGRPFLHARHLAFEHPSTGEWTEFESPLPADLSSVLSRLRQN